MKSWWHAMDFGNGWGNIHNFKESKSFYEPFLKTIRFVTWPQLLVSPVSRRSPWINFGFKKVKLERNADNSGREFWAWIFWVAWNPGETRPKNSLSKFAIKIRWEIRRQFSSNSPDQNKKFTPNPLCITSGPTIGAFFLSLNSCVHGFWGEISSTIQS